MVLPSLIFTVCLLQKNRPEQSAAAWIHCDRKRPRCSAECCLALSGSDDMIQQVAPATLNPSLRDPILPRTPERCPHRTDIHRPNHNRNFQAVLGIPLEYEKSRSGLIREGLAQLLHDPTTGGMPCNAA